MDYTKLDDYRQVIETILSEYASLPYSYAKIQSEVVFDRNRVGAASLKETRYLWMDLGWDGECLRHATRSPHSRLSGSY
ncbi:element excision factor XisI family protein [Nostoc sp. 'Peltigera malacea cyanobiont' DB3992]|uniref:element excision factor XisI family protein n=1 Tax=Nostoc sp. 'Peltigera malacea cyanobiont' DB3992 TaxID=1206980 RepID=UPI000C04FAA4